MTRLKFDATRSDLDLIVQIVERADKLHSRIMGMPLYAQGRRDMLMDLNAAHSNGCPMAFRKLLDAPDGDFAHDVFGISRHLNRGSGKLEDAFMPRFAAVYHKAA